MHQHRLEEPATTMVGSGIADHAEQPGPHGRSATIERLSVEDLEVRRLEHLFRIRSAPAAARHRPGKARWMKLLQLLFQGAVFQKIPRSHSIGHESFEAAWHMTRRRTFGPWGVWGERGGGAASSVGGALAAELELGINPPVDQLLKAALAGEAAVAGRHLDNIAPCLLGGLTLVRSVEDLDVIPLPIDEIWWV